MSLPIKSINGIFKEIYGDDLKDLIPEGVLKVPPKFKAGDKVKIIKSINTISKGEFRTLALHYRDNSLFIPHKDGDKEGYYVNDIYSDHIELYVEATPKKKAKKKEKIDYGWGF